MAGLRAADPEVGTGDPEVGTGKVAEIEGVPRVSSDATFVPMNFVLWLYVKIICSVITGKDFFGIVLCFENSSDLVREKNVL